MDDPDDPELQPLLVKLYEVTEQTIMRLSLNPIETAHPVGLYTIEASADEKAVTEAAVCMLEQYVALFGAGDVMHPVGNPLLYLERVGLPSDRAGVRVVLQASPPGHVSRGYV